MRKCKQKTSEDYCSRDPNYWFVLFRFIHIHSDHSVRNGCCAWEFECIFNRIGISLFGVMPAWNLSKNDNNKDKKIKGLWMYVLENVSSIYVTHSACIQHFCFYSFYVTMARNVRTFSRLFTCRWNAFIVFGYMYTHYTHKKHTHTQHRNKKYKNPHEIIKSFRIYYFYIFYLWFLD